MNPDYIGSVFCADDIAALEGAKCSLEEIGVLAVFAANFGPIERKRIVSLVISGITNKEKKLTFVQAHQVCQDTWSDILTCYPEGRGDPNHEKYGVMNRYAFGEVERQFGIRSPRSV